MSNKIKVIDLLNKIANGEEVPQRVKYKDEEFYYDEECKDYLNDLRCSLLYEMTSGHIGTDILNDTVKIIEEQQDIDIQSLEELDEEVAYKKEEICYAWLDKEKIIVKKMNEIAKTVKQLDKKTRNLQST